MIDGLCNDAFQLHRIYGVDWWDDFEWSFGKDKKTDVANFKVLSQHVDGKTEEGHETFQSG
jgi:hypothetical protein